MLLLDLNWLLILLVLHLLFELQSLHILIGLHVGVKDHPLGSFKGEVGTDWWIGLHTLMTDRKIESLRRSLLEIKGVSNGSLFGFFILLESITAKFSIDNLVHFFKEKLLGSLLVIMVKSLIHGVIRVSQHNVGLFTEMESHMVSVLLNLELSISE